MKIVIYGLAKSGTSALFYKIRNSLPPGTISLFESSGYGFRARLMERLRALRRGRFAPDVLAKVLPWGNQAVHLADFDRFDRQVLLVRDPRDRLVSGLLYKVYNAAFVSHGNAALQYLALLQRKETSPSSVSVTQLLRSFDALESAAGSPTDWRHLWQQKGVIEPLRFHEARPGLPVFRYEQLVDRRFDSLETVLGFPLGGEAEVPQALQRVVRSKGYGAWRDWFTAEDTETLRPIFGPYMERYYPEAEWEPSATPEIAPNHCSVYVERVMNERRALSGLPPIQAPS